MFRVISCLIVNTQDLSVRQSGILGIEKFNFILKSLLDFKPYSWEYTPLLNEPNMVIIHKDRACFFNAIEIIMSYFCTKVTLGIDKLMIENYGILVKS